MATEDIPAFDDLPSFDEMESQAPTQEAPAGGNAPLMFDELPSFDDLPDDGAQAPRLGQIQQKIQPEGKLATFGREAAHAAAPAAGGMVAAGAAGALAGTLGAGPVGTFVGGLAGMILGSMAVDKAQEWSLEQLGFDDAEQRAANAQENPMTAFAGGLAPAVATMSPARGATLLQRGAGAAMMGGFEGGQELINEGTIDPLKVGGAAAVGAAFPQANRAGERLVNIGERATRRFVPGRPGAETNPASVPAQDEAASSQQATVTGENSLQQPAPTVDGATTGNPQSAPTRSSRQYPKGGAPSAEASDRLTQGVFAPDVQEALQASLDANSVQAKELPEIPPQPDADLRRGLNPGEQLPIRTGIEEAAPQAVAEAPPLQQALVDTGIAEAAPPPEAAPSQKIVGEFRTAKGSTYQLHDDGTTTRNKAARPEHPGDEGEKPRSEKTYFLTPEQANALAPPQGRFRIIDHGDGTLSVATPAKGKRWGIAESQRRVGPVETTPQPGLHPLELWSGSLSKQGDRGYNAAHFGNEIVGEGGAQARPEPSEQPPIAREVSTPTPGEELPIKTGIEEAAPAAAPARPEATPEQHPVSARVSESAKEAHPEPSAAQIEAGNQKLGHDRMFGREVSIENAKGSIRRSKPGYEPAWEVEMPYDYGYFRGTKGADGDHVDFANLGTGDRHFIIDQRDANTGKFDEHKVFTYAKDANDAIDHYVRGFSDNKGMDRLGSIKEVSEQELKDWLAKPGKKKTPFDPDFKEPEEGGGGGGSGPTEGERPLPKIVTAAVTKMREAGVPEEAVKKFMDLEPSARIAEASKYVNERKSPGEMARPNRIRTAPPTVEGILSDEGKPVTARDKQDAARKSADVKTMNDAWEKHAPEAKLPSTPEEKRALQEQVRAFLEDVKDVKYKPNLKHAPYLYLRAAKKLLTAKNPSDKSWQEFTEVVHQLRAGNDADVRQGQRIEADIGRNRRSGDEAIAGAEAKSAQAGRNDVEDAMIEAIDAKKGGYIDVPHEEAEAFVKPEPVTSAKDVNRIEKNIRKLDVTKPADRVKLQSETAKLADNLIKTADRKPAAGESEGAASPVRKIKLDDPKMIEEIMARMQKAEARNKSDAPGAVKEEEIGKYDVKAPKPRDLTDFFNDTAGELDHNKIIRDFRNLSKPMASFLTKSFGKLTNDRQRRADSILAHVVADEDARMAEKAHALFDAKYYTWLDKATPADMMTYLKTIEQPGNATKPEIKAALVRNGIASSKADWMADEALFHRDLMDNIWREDAARGSDAGYIQNYVPHIFEDDAGAANFIEQRIKNLGPTWYQKERVFNLIDEAIKAGFKPKFKNPIDLLNARLAASIRSNVIVDAARALQRDGLAFPVAEAPEGAAKVWQLQRHLPDGQRWIFAPDVEHLWMNSVEPAGLNENKGLVGSIYRGWMQIKRFVVPVQLMLSAFHELHIIGNIMPAQALHNAFELSRGNGQWGKNYLQALKNIGHDSVFALPLDKLPLGVGKYLDRGGAFSQYGGRQVQDIWKTPDAELSPNQRMIKQMFKEAGASPYQSREDVIGAKKKLAESIAEFKREKSVGLGAKIAWEGIQRGMEKMQEPMFKYQIPALKNMALLRAMATAVQVKPELATNPTLRGQVFREIGKDIDDRFGEMFYKGLFWNKTAKDIGIGSMLSLSWNLGQYRQVQGAAAQSRRMVQDLFGKQRTSIEQARNTASNKIGFVSHYVGLSMLTAGALSYALSGEFPSGVDYIFPRNGLKNDDGTPMRLTSPFNTREAIMLKAHADEQNSWIGGSLQLLWNKMMLQPVVELATNKDFFGRKLYDPNAPWYKRALQAVDSTLGRTLSPVSVSGADRAREQGGGARDVALAYAGFGPAPKYVNEDPMQRRINHLFSEEGTPYSKPYEYGPKTGLGRGMVQGLIRGKSDPLQSEARGTARHELAQAHLKGDTAAEATARRKLVEQGGLSARTVGKMQSENEFQVKFAHLPGPTQLSLAAQMTPAQFNYYVMTNRSGLSRANREALLQQWARRPKQSSING